MRTIFKLFLPALSVSMLLTACGGGSGRSGSSSGSNSGSSGTSGGSTAMVNTASNSKLGHTVLVSSQGLTLYHLTAETGGRFICTGSCASLWHPLTVSPGTQPTGKTGSLSVVKRPDGTSQVAYKGMPLYTFAQDRSPGEANGQGIKDVGTWSAVTVSGSAGQSSGSGGASSGSGGASSGTGGY